MYSKIDVAFAWAANSTLSNVAFPSPLFGLLTIRLKEKSS